MTLRIRAPHLPRLGNGQSRNETERSRNFVPWKSIPAYLQNFLFQSPAFSVRSFWVLLQNNVGHDHGASNRVSSRPHTRHQYARMAVNQCLNFLRVNFQAPDIDDAAASA